MPYPYSLLPTHSNVLDSPHKSPANLPGHLITNVFFCRRYARISLLALFSFACFVFLFPHDTRPWFRNSDFQNILDSSPYPPYPIPRDTPPEDNPKPPLFEQYSAYEQGFPQYDDSSLFPNDSGRKYIFFADHVWGLGLGNAMQEMILNAHLAYKSDRTFVFDDYTWERQGPYADYNGKLIPAKIPFSVFLAGPLVGQPYSNFTIAHTHPRAVSWQYYNKVCPEGQRYILDPRPLMELLREDSAVQIISTWVEKLQSIEDKCIEIKRDTTQIFDFWLFGSTRIHDILPSLINSPIMRDFSWSPLVHYAFQRNQDRFTSRRESKSFLSILFPYLFSDSTNIPIASSSTTLTPTPPASNAQSLPLLALHLRRGDFAEHCGKLMDWNSTYTGYNTLPDLPDRFIAENTTLLNSMTPEEKKEAYSAKCYIDVDKVRKRVIRAVREWRKERLRLELKRTNGILGWWRRRGAEERIKRMLRKVYVMTNGDREFLNELKTALIADAQRSVLHSFNDKFKKEDEHAKSTSTSTSTSSSDEYDFDFIWAWDQVSTSRDLDLGWEPKYVAQSLDMYIGQRAEVFVGNGFSSLTANVVLLRSIAGVEPWRTRFW